MRRVSALLLFMTIGGIAGAATREIWLPPAKYATEYTLFFSLEDANNPHRFYETAPAVADVHVFQDGTSEARATNAVTDLGRSFSLVLTVAEMTARMTMVDVNDASAPPLFADAIFHIPTFGHANAYHVFDYSKDLDPNIKLILADTNELQTDWMNGGRLDLLIDGIKAMTDLIAIVTTTIAGPNDANTFTITAGRDANDAYWFHAIMVQDATDGHSEVRWIEEYSVGRIVVVDTPFSFTPAAADKVWILGVTYGGLLYDIRSLIQVFRAPIYYQHQTGTGATGGAGGTTRYDASGEDP